MNEAAGGRRHRPRWAGIPAAAVGLVLLTAACSSSPSSSSAASGSGSGTSELVSDMLAFARCVRAHGVPAFPDPNASGQEPASTKNLVSDPHYPAAAVACNYLVAGDFAAQFRVDTLNDVKFAQCMRSHGVPGFPDPSTDPDGSPVFNLQNTSINVSSPTVKSAALGCQSSLHLATVPNYRT